MASARRRISSRDLVGFATSGARSSAGFQFPCFISSAVVTSACAGPLTARAVSTARGVRTNAAASAIAMSPFEVRSRTCAISASASVALRAWMSWNAPVKLSSCSRKRAIEISASRSIGPATRLSTAARACTEILTRGRFDLQICAAPIRFHRGTSQVVQASVHRRYLLLEHFESIWRRIEQH